jgi:hypothetical protein
MYDVLDRSNPVPIIFDNDTFFDICRQWEDTTTVTILMANEAMQKARAAAHVARMQTRAQLAALVRPSYTATRPVPETAPIPIVVDDTFTMERTGPQLLMDLTLQKQELELPDYRFPKIHRAAGLVCKAWKKLFR